MKALMLAVLLSAGLQAAEMPVASAPSEVTVYPQGARVVRAASAELAAGAQTVVLEGLPEGLQEDSLRLAASGPAGTKVLGLRLREAFGEKEAQARRRDLEERIQDLRDQKDDLADRVAARLDEAAVLKAVAAKDAGHSQDAKSLAGLPAAAEAVGRRLAALAAASRKDQRTQRGLDAKIQALQAELNGQGGGTTASRVVEADLDLPTAGRVSLELTYFTPGAGWTPRYDVRLDPAAKEPVAELEFLAELSQQSGEDWKGVKLSLSTAHPTQDSQVPDPTQWWLDYAPEIAFAKTAGLALRRSLPAAAPMAEASAMAAPPATPVPASYSYARTLDLGPATVFVVPGRKDIPSDGTGHRVAIQSGKHPAQLTLVTVPRLSPAGFLEAKIRYQGEQPLLPGPAQLFRDSDLAGQADLPYTAPGETFTLGFGQDERIKAERIRLKQKGGNAGWLASQDRIRYDWLIKVSNHHQGLRTVEVREQLPRSRQDGIKVGGVDLDPKPQPEDPRQPGLQVWRLELKPGQTRELKLGYEVRWPEDKRVQGLE